MKIFNWVHRKFHQKEEHGRRDAKNVELAKNDVVTDTLALLKHVPQMNVLDGWKDGLLTIGTLGFDPLKGLGGHFQQENEYFDEEQEYSTYYSHYNEEFLGDEENHECDFEIDEEEESEMDPLVFKVFKHGFDSDFKANANQGRIDLDQCIIADLSSHNRSDDQAGGHLKYELERKKKGERITLADLFSADSDMNEKSKFDGQGKDDQGNINCKKIGADHHVKKGFSFSKKIIPRGKEDSRPIQKLQKLMTKMLKRKIHPDLQSKETQLGAVNKEGYGGTESLSLLQTQGIRKIVKPLSDELIGWNPTGVVA